MLKHQMSALIVICSLLCGDSSQAEEVKAFDLPEGTKVDESSGWQPVSGPGNLKFGGALRNNKLSVVALPGSSAVVVQSVKADAPAVIDVSVLAKGSAGKISKIELLKKEKSEAVLRLALGESVVDLKVKSGLPFVEITPVKGLDSVEVKGKTKYAVLPDFFGYDTVYDPRRFKSHNLIAPAENFLLGMEEGGDAMIMCVWQGALSLSKKEEGGSKEEAPEPRVELFFGNEGAARQIERMRIDLPAGKPVYVALLASKGIWFDQDTSSWEAQKPMELTWKCPFEAKWRANFLGKEGAWSKDMFSRNLSNDVIYRDAQMRWNGDIPTQSIQGLWPYFICPFWIVNGKPYLALYADMAERKRVEGKKDQYPPGIYERAIIYPFDRRKDTPVNELTLVDVVRETLGQGPCEYVLDLEGVKGRPTGGSRETLGATCGIYENHIERFIEASKGKDTSYKIDDKRLMALKPGEKLSPEFEARLVQALEDMALFISAVNVRIGEYQNFADKMVAFCQAESKRAAHTQVLSDKLLEKAKQLQSRTASTLPGMTKQREIWVEKMAKLVAEVKDGNYANINSSGPIRDYAVNQDIYVAFARRFVKAMREDASTVDSDDPEVVRFSAKVRSMCHDVLRNKHGMEGW